MYCKKCGAKVSEGKFFCTNCGNPVRDKGEPIVESRAKNERQPAERKSQAINVKQPPERKGQRRGKKPWIIGISSGVLALAVVVVVLFATGVLGGKDTSAKKQNDKTAETEPAIKAEYSYEELISEKSPILGYWQSDTVGMYIGYNVSGGNEGFTVYLQSQDFDFRLLHSYNNYKYSGGNNFVQFTYEPQYETNRHEKFEITVEDNDTIILSTSGIRTYEEVILEPQEYTLKRAELDKKELSQYEGTWINGGQVFSVIDDDEYGDVMEFAYCSDCGCVHINEEQNEGSSYHSDNFVCLYDGKTLHYVFPSEGSLVYYSGDIFQVDGDRMEYETYVMEGGSYYSVYFRDGSEEAKVAEALNAYYQYMYDNGINDTDEYEGCELIYLDDDDIPELVYRVLTCDSLLTYNNGEIKETSLDFGFSQFNFKEKKGEFCFVGVSGSLHHADYFEYKNGVISQVGYAGCQFVAYDADSEYEYYEYRINKAGDLVDEKTYDDYMDSFGEYEKGTNCENSSIWEAYEKLEAAE